MLSRGRFGDYGGVYVPEILTPALEQLEAAFVDHRDFPRASFHLLRRRRSEPVAVQLDFSRARL